MAHPILLMALAIVALPAAAELLEARLFDMTTETGMPHLDESLRYAVVHERRCLAEGDLATAFWMLHDVSLRDCVLTAAGADPDLDAGSGLRRFDLVCSGGHGTSGNALWRLEGETLRGTLNVRLGGKNMTFHQRITARAVGACTGPDGAPAPRDGGNR